MKKSSGVTLVLAGLGLAFTVLATRAEDTTTVDLTPLVSVKELMEKTITPATDQLWTAYKAPTSPAEWRVMEEASITLLGASSLVGAGGTGPMDAEWARQPAWQAFNLAMIAAGRAALEASRKQDADALLAAGDLLLPPCEGCHAQFNPAVVGAE